MENAVAAWISDNSEKLNSLVLQIEQTKETVNWYIGEQNKGFFLLKPFDNCSYFTAFPENEESGEYLSEILYTLNERLEKLKLSQSGCVERALKLVLEAVERAFVPFENSDSENADENGDGDETDVYCDDTDNDNFMNRDEYGDYDTLVHRLALEAKNNCDYALLDTKTDMEDNMLAWCSVSVDAHRHAVILSMDVRGILFDSRNFSAALGFPFDGSELIIDIPLADGEWSVCSIGEDFMKFAEIKCYLKDSDGSKRKRIETAEADLDYKETIEEEANNKRKTISEINKEQERKRFQCENKLKIMNVIESTLKTQNFGARVIVREMIKEFKKGKGWWNCENVFVDLLVYVCRSLRQLRQRCVVCKKAIPPLSPLFFCDAEFCLYQLEEEQMGASLLQGLQNTKLAHFLIATAFEASTLGRDVFEPFPPFLLKRQEIRKRSGYFSEIIEINKEEEDSNRAPVSYVRDNGKEKIKNSNKDLDLLRMLIDKFPSVQEMRKCSNEIELIFKMGIPWADISLQVDENPSSIENQCDNQSSKDINMPSNELFKVEKLWDDKQWRPYNLLRFILFTNRLLIRTLPHDALLSIPSYCQFAIIYDSEKEEWFEEQKKKHGSVFAYHGSAACNWYSIIRNGLRSLSHTKFMSAGASFGNGVYFSKASSYSLQYTSPMKIENEMTCCVMAICEIINGHQYDKASDILVVPPAHEHEVAIRYIILWNCSDRYSTDQAFAPSIKDGYLLGGKVDLHEHYKNQKKEYLQECINERLIQRKECTDLLKQRREKAIGV